MTDAFNVTAAWDRNPPNYVAGDVMTISITGDDVHTETTSTTVQGAVGVHIVGSDGSATDIDAPSATVTTQTTVTTHESVTIASISDANRPWAVQGVTATATATVGDASPVVVNLVAGDGATSTVTLPGATVSQPGPAPKPVPPTGLTAAVSGTSVTLDWNDSPDLRSGDKYQVYLDDQWGNRETAVSSYTLTGVAAGSHTARVSAGQVGSYGDWSAAVPFTIGSPPPSGPIQALPGQPATFSYGATPNSNVLAYAKPGGLVITGRSGQDHANYKQVSAGGGTVLIYVDALIKNTAGTYHSLLFNASQYGAAVPDWPGSYQANQYGKLADFRTGSILQTKLEAVLERIVTDNPHMGGFFADDLGSRSWYPGINWSTFPDKTAYRAGAIALAQTFRRVCDRHRLMLLVNGTWTANDGGGYPNTAVHGCSLAEGGVVEHHGTGELSYWTPYAASSAQWGDASPITSGVGFCLDIASDTNERTAYANAGYSYIAVQSTAAGYDSAVAPWGAFHPTGLPSKAS